MRKKIEHPFQTPDKFFEDFKNNMEHELAELPTSKHIYWRKTVMQFAKYAAIVLIAFLLGRYSVKMQQTKANATDLEAIINQVSEEEIVDFIIEDELFNQL